MIRCTSLLLVITSCAGLGCGNAAKQGTVDPPRSNESGLTLTMTSAPDMWEELEGGQFLLEGVLTTTVDLDPEEPCTILIEDLVTGFKQKALIMTSTETWPGSQTPLFPNTVIPLAGGAFEINAITDYRISSEGFKRITVTFKDENEDTASWSGYVEVPPFWPEVSRATLSAARRRYGIEMLQLLSTYRAMLENLQESGLAGGAIAANLDYDLAVLRVFEESFTEALIVHADMAQWPEIGASLESRILELHDLGGVPTGAENSYRLWVEELAASYHRNLKSDFQFASGFQWWFGSEGKLSDAPVPNGDRWDVAFFLHTFGEAHSTTDSEEYRYEARILVDEGSQPWYEAGDPPFVEPQWGTAETNNPVLDITVTLTDSDEDGALDLPTITGTVNGLSLEQALEVQEIETYGHMLTPLQVLDYCDFWKPVCGTVN